MYHVTSSEVLRPSGVNCCAAAALQLYTGLPAAAPALMLLARLAG